MSRSSLSHFFFLLAAGFDPVFQIFGVHRPLGVVELGITQLPALFYKPVDDVLLEVFFPDVLLIAFIVFLANQSGR
ncbi:hypothetical protein [Citrobacter werkmanii]|uniref:hypothetical protein n=1 Tax=Citrobacter werkmanii TaxID=67827 RepID=UPI001EF18EA8|nr:hypothetical protein [Citrobacter werkmanii]